MGIHSNTYKNYTKGDKDPSEDDVTASQKAQDKTISTGKICFFSEIKCTSTCTSTVKFGLSGFFLVFDGFSEQNFLPFLELFCIWDLRVLIFQLS